MPRQALLDALDTLSRVLPDAGAVAYVRGPGGGVLRLAGDVRRMAGRDARELEGDADRWWAVVHPEDRDLVRVSARDVAPGETVTLEYRMVRPSGGETWVRDTMVGLPAEYGGGAVGTLANVGLERSFRAQIAALEARIWESQRLESLGALSGSVAHDFNNLLTTILSSTQLLEGQVQGLDREARKDLHLIQDAAQRGAALVRQILRFAARREESVGPVDVNAMVGGIEPILRRRIGREVRLEVRPGSGLPATVGDVSQLEQVLLNLVVNAREATPDGGVIVVATDLERRAEPFAVEGDDEPLPAGSYLRVSVTDSGPGIPEETRARIFEPFFSTKRARGGSGLGLSTVQRIVRGQGGGIRVDTAPGRGTTFHIYLRARSAAPTAELRAASLPQPAPQRYRVLVVEDDDSVRQLLERTLAGDGHAVVSVASAGEALRTFDRARPPFDAVVADVILGDRSGPEVVRALRRRTPGLAAVHISGYGHDAAQARGAEADDVFLPKPFTARELHEALVRAIRRAAEDGTSGERERERANGA